MQFTPPLDSLASHSMVTDAVTSLQVLQKPRVSDLSNVQFPVGQPILRVEFAVPKLNRLLYIAALRSRGSADASLD